MIPLSLYIHLPWCVRKCPYCDFNSHKAPEKIPEDEYIQALLKDLDNDLSMIWGRKIQTIFIGGGTPSLFSASSLQFLLQQIHARLAYSPNSEITLEANPGTLDMKWFMDYREIGINRLSLGIQSFQDDKLSALGRIHDAKEAHKALEMVSAVGFNNFNVDLMYGLPNQSIEDALLDLTQAISYSPTHISWYQLTIEPNTAFFHSPPELPSHDYCWEMQNKGQQMLARKNYIQYEISAYSQPNFQCQHNRNYWEFGDYLGIGAGAHSKLSDPTTGKIFRLMKIKHPKLYLAATEYTAKKNYLTAKDIPLEFMLNALRLDEPIANSLFEERTGLPIMTLESSLQKAENLELLTREKEFIKTTQKGKQFLNDLLGCFY